MALTSIGATDRPRVVLDPQHTVNLLLRQRVGVSFGCGKDLHEELDLLEEVQVFERHIESVPLAAHRRAPDLLEQTRLVGCTNVG